MMHEQPSAALISGIGAFNHPTLGQHGEAVAVGGDGKQFALSGRMPTADLAIGGVAHDVDVETVIGAELGGTLTSVASVDEQRR